MMRRRDLVGRGAVALAGLATASRFAGAFAQAPASGFDWQRFRGTSIDVSLTASPHASLLQLYLTKVYDLELYPVAGPVNLFCQPSAAAFHFQLRAAVDRGNRRAHIEFSRFIHPYAPGHPFTRVIPETHIHLTVTILSIQFIPVDLACIGRQ